MRAKTFEFECREHKEYGENGWAPTWSNNADPLGGMAVAHDCLEHFPGGDQGVEDELLALGAMVRVREYSDNMHSLGKNIGSDLREVLSHHINEGMPLRNPGRTYPTDVEHEWDDAIQTLTKESEDDPDLDSFLKDHPEILGYIRGWLRKGFRRATKRWEGVYTRGLFKAIEDRATKELTRASEGDKLKVTLTFNKCKRVDVKVIRSEFWEGSDDES